MDFKTLENKILEVLNNLDTVNVSNKIKAEAIRIELENILTHQSKVYKVGETNASHQTH